MQISDSLFLLFFGVMQTYSVALVCVLGKGTESVD